MNYIGCSIIITRKELILPIVTSYVKVVQVSVYKCIIRAASCCSTFFRHTTGSYSCYCSIQPV